MCEVCWKACSQASGLGRSYINNLPDEAFAVIEPAYKNGETKSRNARHLPHHLAGVRRGRRSDDDLDVNHLKSAIACMNRIVPVTGSISTKKLCQLAREHLNKHSRDLGLISGEKKGEEESFSENTEGKEQPSLPADMELSADGTIVTGLVNPIGEIDSSNFEAKAVLDEEGMPIQIDSLKPKEGDYLIVPVRALSKAFLESKYLDFRDGDVLKDSMSLLKGVTVFTDHNKAMENWLGSVSEVSWSESPSPAGIDALLKIDGLANPKITRGLLNDPPAINRVSVNIQFEWRKSHDDMTSEEFWGALGRKVDGEVVRFIVTRIKHYGEISFVYMGADKTAKRKSA